MSVLTLSGKAINWAKPPKPTDRVMWSKRDKYGRKVTGSLRTIAHLDHLDSLAQKKFGVGIVVLQPPFNEGVKASAGTHDFDACLDVWIPGVSGPEQQSFFRANGAGAYLRVPPAFTIHIHYFTLPPAEGVVPSDDYARAGFKVGMYVDGGWSLFGKVVASSQIADYYEHRTALAGHAYDPSWFPADIRATIFDLDAYVQRQLLARVVKGPDKIVTLGSHAPLARLGGEAGAALWEDWEAGVRKQANRSIRSNVTTFLVADTNKHGALPNFGAVSKALMARIGGKGIDLIGVRRAKGGAKVRVLKRKRVDLTIDGHDGFGVKVKITFPSGCTVKTWIVQANLGRGAGDEKFLAQCEALLKAFGKNAIYHFNEIDEADAPNEHRLLRTVFGPDDFAVAGWPTMTPVLVGRKRLVLVHSVVSQVSPGLAKVSPARSVVKSVIAPK